MRFFKQKPPAASEEAAPAASEEAAPAAASEEAAPAAKLSTQQITKLNTTDQLPAYILKYAILCNLAYSYPTYFYLGLSLYNNALTRLNEAQFVDINKNQLIGLKDYVTNYTAANKKNQVLSYESRHEISDTYNKNMKTLIEYENKAAEAKKTKQQEKGQLADHKFNMTNDHLAAGQQFLKTAEFAQNYATMYIHTSDDLSCYIVADISNKNKPEIHVVFRGSRSLKNAVSDVKGFIKESLCNKKLNKEALETLKEKAEETFKKAKAFGGAVHLEKEVLNVMVYSMVYLQKEFIEKRLTEEKLPKTTISITGHSLGGCLCSLFALYFYKLLKNPDFFDSPTTTANKGGKKTKKHRKNKQRRTRKGKRGGGVKILDFIGLPFKVVAVSSPRPFNEAAEKEYVNAVNTGYIEHINYTSRGDPVTSMPPNTLMNFYHPMETKNEKTGKGIIFKDKSSPYSIRSTSTVFENEKVNPNLSLDTSNIKGGITRINPFAHGSVGGISFMHLVRGYTVGSDITFKGIKVLAIIPKKGEKISTTSHNYPFSENAIITSYTAYVKEIGDKLKSDNVLTPGPISLNEGTQKADATAKGFEAGMCGNNKQVVEHDNDLTKIVETITYNFLTGKPKVDITQKMIDEYKSAVDILWNSPSTEYQTVTPELKNHFKNFYTSRNYTTGLLYLYNNNQNGFERNCGLGISSFKTYMETRDKKRYNELLPCLIMAKKNAADAPKDSIKVPQRTAIKKPEGYTDIDKAQQYGQLPPDEIKRIEKRNQELLLKQKQELLRPNMSAATGVQTKAAGVVKEGVATAKDNNQGETAAMRAGGGRKKKVRTTKKRNMKRGHMRKRKTIKKKRHAKK